MSRREGSSGVHQGGIGKEAGSVEHRQQILSMTVPGHRETGEQDRKWPPSRGRGSRGDHRTPTSDIGRGSAMGRLEGYSQSRDCVQLCRGKRQGPHRGYHSF